MENPKDVSRRKPQTPFFALAVAYAGGAILLQMMAVLLQRRAMFVEVDVLRTLAAFLIVCSALMLALGIKRGRGG